MAGFTSINRVSPKITSTTSDSDEEIVLRTREPASEEQSAKAGHGKYIPLISLVEFDRSAYADYTQSSNVVKNIVGPTSISHDEEEAYEIEFEDFHTGHLTLDQLLSHSGGAEAIRRFRKQSRSRSVPISVSSSRSGARRRVVKRDGFVNTIDAVQISDDDNDDVRSSSGSAAQSNQASDHSQSDEELHLTLSDSEAESRESARYPTRRNVKRAPNLRSSRRTRTSMRGRESQESDKTAESDSDALSVFTSDLPGSRRRKRGSRQKADRFVQDDIAFVSRKRQRTGMRQSGRVTRHRGGMEEVDVSDIYASDSEAVAPAKPRLTSTKEVFRRLPHDNEFRKRHIQQCDTCGDGPSTFPLIYCQGCVLAYHKSCLGNRSSRDHLVTKVGHEQFVLQCRRCIAVARRKDLSAPDQGRCQDCGEHGINCTPFTIRKTAVQEQKERDDNDGVDPILDIDQDRIDNASHVLFRCTGCTRAWHFRHLPSRSNLIEIDEDIDIEQRFREYSRDWQCKECLNAPAKVSALVAWRPVDEDRYDPSTPSETMNESDKAYLVKWEGMSYFRAVWVPGAWVWGVTAAAMRKAFAKREDAIHPKMPTEDAIPEDYLRTDIVLDVEYTNFVDIRTVEVDKARVREVRKALIKYRGLGYEDAVWEAPPIPEDGERWTDFVLAYNDWVAGHYVRMPHKTSLQHRLEKARKEDFTKLEKQSQPETLVGGELMKYQLQGLNWLYYKWFTQKNAILADEMGLGKTIQIIGFLTTLVQDWNCYPFLIVVPNSTCPNWRREIKRWAPSLRVVAYYGSKESRKLCYKYEMFPDGATSMRCHVVVTSYDAATDDDSRKFFRSTPWQALIVDEGQRLKNDSSLLYTALTAMKAPFKVLVTGTPLQNNQRELFNLLHFLDNEYDAAKMEEEYEELDQEKIAALHETIRPFFLRRTKAQVLTFLPPMGQIILPVSMTVVQKKLYRSILAKSPELMKAIFSTEGPLNKNDRASLSNILMQLRKCLCHPFVYSKSIEDRNVSIAASHRNLVDASSKLQLLEGLLPKLRDGGHRVLIFSQFLDMLDIVEDFLDGMQMKYQRLDGSINALTKQKRIDAFNAPDSPLFAFLLSTRAGGVGINLATADTVIILDPDFNPHQDIQALSRAHRIGQAKKVLCFQLVTRGSAEERIMQIGRKKLALDHVLIQEMDAEDAEQTDLVSILKHGASELFEDSAEHDIVYDSASLDTILDRSQLEKPRTEDGEQSAETSFSTARVWATNVSSLQNANETFDREEKAPDAGVWDNILRERERLAAEAAAAQAEALGRGRRARANIEYGNDIDGVEFDATPVKNISNKRGADQSDTDFQTDGSGSDDDEPSGDESAAGDRVREPHTFRRATVPTEYPQSGTPPHSAPGQFDATSGSKQQREMAVSIPNGLQCLACLTYHAQGSCPLKRAGVEYCNLCGLAHFGYNRICPHIQSETQVRAMLETLKSSNEPPHLVAEARKYLRGLKGNLVQEKKQKEAKEAARRQQEAMDAAAMQYAATGRPPVNVWRAVPSWQNPRPLFDSR